MLRYAGLGCILVVSFVGAATAIGQQSAPPAQAGRDKMYLDVVVTQKSGPPVAGLQQQDFTLLDNKVPQTITLFQAAGARDAQVAVIVVIDAVNDTLQNVDYERHEIDQFLRADTGKLKYPVGLAVFTDTGIKGISHFSLDGNALSDALDKATIGPRDIGRTAGFWGAAERVQMSLAALDQLLASQAALPERKVMVWVSPGWPLLFSPQPDAGLQKQTFADIVKISSALRQARVTLYDVNPLGTGESVMQATYYQNFLEGISKPSQTQVADLGLQVLAVQSGGLVLNSSNDITSLLEQCIADTAPYYELSFEPSASKRPSEYHRLDIRLAKTGLVARTRQGYYSH